MLVILDVRQINKLSLTLLTWLQNLAL